MPRPPDDSIAALADRCVQCGLCLPHCPTYALEHKETESPRGRIALARAIDQGRMAADDASAAKALDHCLGCGSCQSVCPAKVDYASILVGTRATQRARRGTDARQRLLEWTTSNPGRLRLLAIVARWLPAWGRFAPWIRRLRRPPPVGLHPPIGARRGRIWLATGCLGHFADAETHRDAIRVLTRLGWEVLAPRDARCCGTLHAHAGNVELADRLGSRLADAVPADVDAVVVCASGCFAHTRRALAPRPVHEIMAFLDQAEMREALRALGVDAPPVALHVPCTQRNAVGRADAAASTLAACGADTSALTAGCCGAAGAQLMLDPRRARAVGAPVIDSLTSATGSTLASQNFLCAVHLQQAWATARPGVRCLHPVSWIAQHL